MICLLFSLLITLKIVYTLALKSLCSRLLYKHYYHEGMKTFKRKGTVCTIKLMIVIHVTNSNFFGFQNALGAINCFLVFVTYNKVK